MLCFLGYIIKVNFFLIQLKHHLANIKKNAEREGERESKISTCYFMHNIQIEQHDGSAATVVVKKVKSMAKQKAFDQLADSWEQNPQHGKYVARSKQADVDQKQIHQWQQVQY